MTDGPARTAIPEIAFDLAKFDRDYRQPRRPVVLKGGAASWNAVASWTPELFESRYGELQIEPSMDLPDTEVPYQYRDVDYRQAMSVRQFVEHMDRGERC